MRKGKKKNSVKEEASKKKSVEEEGSIEASDSADTSSTKSNSKSNSRRKLGSRVKGLFKGRSKRKNRGDDSDSDVTSLQGMDEDAVFSHPAAGLTHEMLGIPEEEDDFMNHAGDGNRPGNLDSRDPMDQTSPMEGGVDDKYLGGNYDDLIEKDVNSIIVVLLLIDPITLRFELLQLELDSRQAKVSDALAEVPDSATEMAIKSQSYKGVVDGQLRAQSEKTLIKSFAKMKDVLVAREASQSLEEATRLARPILSDEKVVTMLRGSGFDVSAWANDDDGNGSSMAARKNTTRLSIFWNKYVQKYVPYFKMVASVMVLAILAYILSNIKIHGLDELIQYSGKAIQHVRESMRSDWRLATGSKWSGREWDWERQLGALGQASKMIWERQLGALGQASKVIFGWNQSINESATSATCEE